LHEKTFLNQTSLPTQIRVSLGTAIVLGLLESKLDSEPTTAYLMTYRAGKCTANCGFCPQARASKSSTELLSRVSWPTFPTQNVLTALAETANLGKIRRVCIQALNYLDVFLQLEVLVKEIKKGSAIPVSVSCQPLKVQNIELLKQCGVDRLGIALDASTKELFNKVKGSGTGSLYSWENQFTQMNNALGVFGKGNVSTHVIFGIGETEKEATEVIQTCVDMTVLPGLFAFTPIRGTALEAKSPPKLEAYRRVQLARYLIVNGETRSDNMQFDYEGKIISFGVSNEALEAIVDSGLPFRTSGCPDCNRPFYNEKPSGPIYNYSKHPRQEEIEKIKKQLLRY
jgi:biotin synthase-related radical SAM superfamily protein